MEWWQNLDWWLPQHILASIEAFTYVWCIKLEDVIFIDRVFSIHPHWYLLEFFYCVKMSLFHQKTYLSICIHHHIIFLIKSPNIFAHIFIDTPALFQDLDVLHGYAVVKNTYFNRGYIKTYIEISWGVYIFGWNKDSLLFNGNRTTFWDI